MDDGVNDEKMEDSGGQTKRQTWASYVDRHESSREWRQRPSQCRRDELTTNFVSANLWGDAYILLKEIVES